MPRRQETRLFAGNGAIELITMARKAKTLTINDGTLVITLEEAEEGGYVVTSPMDPALITQGETIEECLFMARDAAKLLHEYRRDRDRKRPRKAMA